MCEVEVVAPARAERCIALLSGAYEAPNDPEREEERLAAIKLFYCIAREEGAAFAEEWIVDLAERLSHQPRAP